MSAFLSRHGVRMHAAVMTNRIKYVLCFFFCFESSSSISLRLLKAAIAGVTAFRVVYVCVHLVVGLFIDCVHRYILHA